MPLEVGERAPEITLPSHALEQVTVGGANEQSMVVLFFPLAFTSTCTAELCTVGEDLAAYRQLNARVVAISVDSPFALQRFRDECRAGFPFLSDFHREATEAYGVLREAPLGPGLRSVSDRAAFVIDPAGVVTYVWHSTNPSVLPPFEEIKSALEVAARESAAR